MKARFLDGPLDGQTLDVPFDEPILRCAHYMGDFSLAELEEKQLYRDIRYQLIGIEFGTGIRLYRLFEAGKVRDWVARKTLNSLKLTHNDERFLRSLHISSE